MPGIPELREAVAGYYARFYGAKAAGSNTIVSNGGKQVLYNLLMALVNPGDEVLLPAPYWVSYPAMIQLAEGVSVFVPTAAEENYLITVDGLEAARHGQDPHTHPQLAVQPDRLLLQRRSSSRPSPGGRAKTASSSFPTRSTTRLVYDPFTSGFPGQDLGSLPRNHRHRGRAVQIVLHDRLARGLCPGPRGPDQGLNKIQGQSTSNINSITQKAAIAALNGPWDIVDEMKKSFVRRRDYAYDVITGWGAVCPKPDDGAFYLFPVLDQFYTEDAPDSAAMCTKILEEAGVALVPGSAFGDDKCIRFSYAVEDDILKNALDRVGKVLKG